MKALPCQTASCSGAPRSNGIIAMSNGEPYVVGRPSSFPLVAKCAKCLRPSKFTATQFAKLPELTVERLEQLKQLEPLTRDWLGHGLTRDQAVQTIAAGFMGPGSIQSHEPVVRKTGAECPTSGVWRADNGSTIPLTKGEKFPPSKRKSTQWTLVNPA